MQRFDGLMTADWLLADGSMTDDHLPIWLQYCYVKWRMICVQLARKTAQTVKYSDRSVVTWCDHRFDWSETDRSLIAFFVALIGLGTVDM